MCADEVKDGETKLPRWLCEYCFRIAYGYRLPAGWDMVWQFAVCPTCRERVIADGGYMKVKSGAYAIGPDPRRKLKVEVMDTGSATMKGPELLSGRPLTAEETAGFPVGDPFNEHGLMAAAKKQCGLCGHKDAGKGVWECHHSEKFLCPYTTPPAECPGFARKPSGNRPFQAKKKGLPVPPGVKFLYFGRPQSRSQKHQGVVTVAMVTPAPGILHLGFSFCSPKDHWCKVTGRDMALSRLLHPLAVPFIYDANRTTHEFVKALLFHDFERLEALVPGVTAWGHVQISSWTKDLAKMMETRRVSGIRFVRRIPTHGADAFSYLLCGNSLFERMKKTLQKGIHIPKPTASQIIAEMWANFAKLGRL